MPEKPAPPAPDASPQEIASWMAAVGDRDASKWFNENSDAISEDALLELVELTKTIRSPYDGRSTTTEAIYRRLSDIDEERRGIEKEAGERINSGQRYSEDVDGDGEVSDMEREAFEKKRQEVIESVKEDAKERGLSGDDAEREATAAEDELERIAGNASPEPPGVLSYTGGLAPSPEQQRDLVEAWNEYNPDEPVRDYAQLKEIFKSRPSDPMVKVALEAGFEGVEPIMEYVIRTGGARVTIDEGTFQSFKAAYGETFDHKDLTTFVRWAGQLGISDSMGRPAWQVVAGLARWAGIADPTIEVPAAQKAGPSGEIINAREREIATSRKTRNGRRITQLGLKYKQGLAMYGGNQTLAFLSAVNPQLAMRVANTKPELWSQNDISSMNQIVLTAGFDRETLASMGFFALNLDEWMGQGGGRYLDPEEAAERLRREKDAEGQANVKQYPDPVAVKQAARDFYVTLFAEEPTPEQLEQFAGVVSSAISGSAGNVNVDPNAHIRDAARSTPKYKELYGAKPGGMSEEEYQQQFRNAAASMLGGAAPDPTVIQQGMRTGRYQTSVGAAAGSKQAWENSTFLGRLAQAAQVVSENT